MADNVTANSGTGGATFAADDILGVHYPRTKLVIGADGANDGDVSSANPLPVTNGGLTELAAAINASSQMDVNIAASGATVPVSNAGLTELAAAINASSQLDINIAASAATLTVASHAVTNAGTFAVQPSPSTTGGLSIFRSLDLDETEEDVKTAAGMVYSLIITNIATTTRFVKFYNATAANVVVGTTTPVITIPVPGNASDDTTLVWNNGGMGIAFDTAICVAATTGLADADTGAPAANDVVINVFYK